MSKISTTGPSFKAGYTAGYEAAMVELNNRIHELQSHNSAAYDKGKEAGLAYARRRWVERMAELRAQGLLRELATIDS